MPISITGQLKVSTLQSRFLKEFGLTLRIYDGRSFADPDQTLAQVRKKKGSGNDLSVAKNMKVGNLEDKFEAEFGLKVQVAGSDDSYLCDNDLTLNQAKLEDEKKTERKDRKSAKNASKNVGVDKAVAPDDVKSRPGNDNMFRVEVNPEDGYKIRLIDDIDPKNLSFSIDEINFYDDEIEDDVIVEIDGSKLKFFVEGFDEEANAYQIGFSGYLSAEINENEKSILKKINYRVDYNLNIENDGDDFEQDESYELIHNSNIVLSSGDLGGDAKISYDVNQSTGDSDADPVQVCLTFGAITTTYFENTDGDWVEGEELEEFSFTGTDDLDSDALTKWCSENLQVEFDGDLDEPDAFSSIKALKMSGPDAAEYGSSGLTIEGLSIYLSVTSPDDLSDENLEDLFHLVVPVIETDEGKMGFTDFEEYEATFEDAPSDGKVLSVIWDRG